MSKESKLSKKEIVSLIYEADNKGDCCGNEYCSNTKNQFCFHCPLGDYGNRIHETCQFC